jgi:hypothetical protein
MVKNQNVKKLTPDDLKLLPKIVLDSNRTSLPRKCVLNDSKVTCGCC